VNGATVHDIKITTSDKLFVMAPIQFLHFIDL